MIAMKTYRELDKQIEDARRSHERIEVHKSRILKDVQKRKTKRIVMTVFVCLGIVALPVLMILAPKIIEYPLAGSPYVDALMEWFIGVTWLLCWVGFPIGWGLNRKDRQDAKSQVSVTYVVDEHGYVERRASTLPARIAAFFMSLFAGMITMIGSFVIAIVQIFTTRKDLKYIQGVLDKADTYGYCDEK